MTVSPKRASGTQLDVAHVLKKDGCDPRSKYKWPKKFNKVQTTLDGPPAARHVKLIGCELRTAIDSVLAYR
jgi:hypothetical protein